MMHTNQQWSFKQSNNNAYGVDDDDDDEDANATVNDVDFGNFGVGGDLTSTERRYLTVQPKQWCTSYVGANRQHYVSTYQVYY